MCTAQGGLSQIAPVACDIMAESSVVDTEQFKIRT
jgi:hypothetical protein